MSRFPRFFLVLLALLASTLVFADPPARVGRLALVEGGVDFRASRHDEGGPASINWPISSGALLETERRGRAEVWVGSTAFRLAGNSQLAFPVLDDRQVALQLLSGTLAVSILDREQADDVTVQTPEGRISFNGPGRYRIDVLADRSELTVQAGRAVFNDGGRSYPVAAGDKASIEGGGRLSIEPEFEHDAFDNWVAQRENLALANDARRHVSPAMTGYQDLDTYGDWRTVPEYGAIWYPRSLANDWAPYRFGRWVWVTPWGWTWVDQAPWGFAPFHYGRWVQVGGRWGWAPGSYVARPVYAPALVAWIGNPGWSASFNFGTAPAVGWFPLAPREVYVPGFRATPSYVRQVNVGHVRDQRMLDSAMRDGAARHFMHREMPQAVTVVPAGHLSEGRPIGAGVYSRPQRRELERAPQATAAPMPALLPPAVQPRHEGREDRRPASAPPGRMPEERPQPGSMNQDGREADGRRGGFRREMSPPPGPAVQAGRPPEPARIEAERRPSNGAQPQPQTVVPQAPVPQPLPQLRPGQPPVSPQAAPAPAPLARPVEPAARPSVQPISPAEMDGHRGGFQRDAGQPRAMPPGRPPEPVRVEPERRPPPVAAPVSPPAMQPPAPRPAESMRPPEIRREPARDMPRPEREAPRPREMAPPAPAPAVQAAPQPMRAPPPPQAAPMPAPAPARAEPRPPEQQRGGNPERRRGERGDEPGPR